MEPPVPQTDTRLIKALVIIVGVIVILVLGFSVHSCVYNPTGPHEFNIGYAPVP